MLRRGIIAILAEAILLVVAVMIDQVWLQENARWILPALLAGLTAAVFWPQLISLFMGSRPHTHAPKERLEPQVSDPDLWDDLETSAQYFYNELTSGRFNDAGQLRQAMKAFDGIWGGVSGWIIDGIRRDIIKARGVCEQRSIAEPVPPALKGAFDNEYPDGCVEDQEGLTWRITEINHQSLDRYLEALERDEP